ncbi:MAG: hypothetical protein PHC61_15140, partial [Chitinivibrionales bacterium]|nr:hypothetical protein [Chitinivibrionales bacterium]
IDPITGTATAIGTYSDSGTRTFTPPSGWAEAVLLCKAKTTTMAHPWNARVANGSTAELNVFDLSGRAIYRGKDAMQGRLYNGNISDLVKAARLGKGVYLVQRGSGAALQTRIQVFGR